MSSLFLRYQSEAKAHVPSKAEREAAETARRDEALSTSTLGPSSKGFHMMAKLGYKAGSALGKPEGSESGSMSGQQSTTPAENEWKPVRERLTEPLGINVKEDRGGIGLDAERKRKFRDEVDAETKRVKVEEGDFRERVRQEREEKRKEGQFHAAQKVAERLDTGAEENQPSGDPRQPPQPERDASDGGDDETRATRQRNIKPTSQINVLYRGLVRSREEKLREIHERRRRYDSLSMESNRLFPDMSRLPTYKDSTFDPDDELALSRTAEGDIAEVELDDENEDKELEEFNALGAEERLSRVVRYLRDKYYYCFWCKCRYDTDEMERCPGPTEDDHD